MTRILMLTAAMVVVVTSVSVAQTQPRWVINPFATYTHPASGRQVKSGKILFYSAAFALAASSTDPVTGVPKRNWALMAVCSWRPEAEADPEIIFLPDLRLGQGLGDQAALIAAALTATDVDVTALPTDTLRAFLIRLARQKLDQTTGFDPGAFECP